MTAVATVRAHRPAGQMGYQPSLDGLRAISVIGVILYHAGFSWMKGGFFGVEVFFVVSGFLITSLLLDEHERVGFVDFRDFWRRRIRRLFPALYAVLLAVGVWAAVFGSAEQAHQVRRDVPWAVLYAGNWGTILGDVPYFAGDPPLLRHLWSLAVEEQWYVVWPLAFVGLMSLRWPARRVAVALFGAAGAIALLTFWLHAGGPGLLGGPPGLFDDVDRTNFMYLSTITRSGGLLMGAGAAFVWRPWRSRTAAQAPAGRLLDPLGATAVAALGCTFAAAVLTDGYVYQWLLPLVSLLSLVAVLVAVHPAAAGFRRALSWRPLVEVGKRSYGLYLWSWPISVIVGATEGSVGRFVVAMLVTVVVAEASYRFVENPIRLGVIGRWWRAAPRPRYGWTTVGSVTVVAVGLVGYYATVEPVDRFTGGDEVAAFELDTGSSDVDATTDAPTTEPVTSPETEQVATSGSTSTQPETVVPVTVSPAVSARLAIVGDSVAGALVRNLPSGIESVFPAVVDAALAGCSVHEEGTVSSSSGYRSGFSICEGWQDDWREAATRADVVLVVLGAWDVFDITVDGTTYVFDTPAADELFTTNLRQGIDVAVAGGANVALLEVACMRPIDVEGAGVPALPERGDDSRVAHVNELLRSVADTYGSEVAFVEGPDEWCADETIATDVGYRWDGVHVYRPGAKLVIETIAPALLALAAV